MGGLILAGIGTALAIIGLGWQVLNANRDRRERKVPDVYGVMVVPGDESEPSELAFVNAGRGIARSVQYLYIGDRYVYGGFPFLLPEQADSHSFKFRAKDYRSTFVWLYMDVEGRVYARANDGKVESYARGAEVSLRETFATMYPDVELPDGPDQVVGE